MAGSTGARLRVQSAVAPRAVRQGFAVSIGGVCQQTCRMEQPKPLPMIARAWRVRD